MQSALTPENDLRLTVLASLRGTDRSTLLNSILDDALRGVVVSLRGPLASERRGRGGGCRDGDPRGRLEVHDAEKSVPAGTLRYSDANKHRHRSSKELAADDETSACVVRW